MTSIQAQELVSKLQEQGIQFVEGLTHEEVLQVQQRYNFQFPPDLKAFLQTAIPVSPKFYDWRAALTAKEEIDWVNRMLHWPLEGLLYDVEHNNFWHHTWGTKPASLDEKKKIATEYYLTYPRLIPVFSHRYMPATPAIEGNPVFSVYQTDIIYYGNNLPMYLAGEFFITLSDSFTLVDEPVNTIEFWSEIVC